MCAKKKESEIEKLSFEDSVSQLEEIVRRLEEGGSSNLDKSIEDYTKGVELKKQTEKKLKEAKLKVEKIISGEGKKISTEKFDME